MVAEPDTIPEQPHPALSILRMLWRDKFAFCAAIFLLIVIGCALFGPYFLEDIATRQNLRGRNAPPFDFSRPWVYWLGGDALGRPLLARIIVAAQNTMMISALATSARVATWRRVAASSSAVSPRNTGVLATGFIMAKNPMNTESRCAAKPSSVPLPCLPGWSFHYNSMSRL